MFCELPGQSAPKGQRSHWLIPAAVPYLTDKCNKQTSRPKHITNESIAKVHSFVGGIISQRFMQSFEMIEPAKNWMHFLERISSCRCTHLRLLRPWLAVLTLYRTRSSISTRRALPKVAKRPIHEKNPNKATFLQAKT